VVAFQHSIDTGNPLPSTAFFTAQKLTPALLCFDTGFPVCIPIQADAHGFVSAGMPADMQLNAVC